jgi:hypothetical protein
VAPPAPPAPVTECPWSSPKLPPKCHCSAGALLGVGEGVGLDDGGGAEHDGAAESWRAGRRRDRELEGGETTSWRCPVLGSCRRWEVAAPRRRMWWRRVEVAGTVEAVAAIARASLLKAVGESRGTTPMAARVSQGERGGGRRRWRIRMGSSVRRMGRLELSEWSARRWGCSVARAEEVARGSCRPWRR